MTPFIVVTSDPLLIEAIQKVYEGNNLKYTENVWFIADQGVTAQDVYRKLIAPNEPVTGGPSGIVCTVAGYYGIAGRDVWEWLVAKGNASKVNGSST